MFHFVEIIIPDIYRYLFLDIPVKYKGINRESQHIQIYIQESTQGSMNAFVFGTVTVVDEEGTTTAFQKNLANRARWVRSDPSLRVFGLLG